MDHCIRVAYGYADVPLYPFRGPLSTAGIESLRDGPFRRYRSAFRVEIEACGAAWSLNAPFSSVANHLRDGVMGEKLWRSVGWEVSRQVQLDGEFEPNPNRDSRVTLARDCRGNLVLDPIGVPRPRLDLVLDDFTVAGAQAFSRLADEVMLRMGGQRAQFVPGFLGAGHLMGTFRMGVDAKESVADEHGRTWDHDNLYLTGSGLFPTVCSANPTLTITAVTLRQIEHLKQRLKAA
jgi:choline dehydrogenase-like flavoprotein